MFNNESLTQDIPGQCLESGSGSVLLSDYATPVNGLEVLTGGTLTGVAFSTAINILVSDTDGIDCDVVQANEGVVVTITIEWVGGEDLPSTCTLPWDYQITLPAINGDIPPSEAARHPRTPSQQLPQALSAPPQPAEGDGGAVGGGDASRPGGDASPPTTEAPMPELPPSQQQQQQDGVDNDVDNQSPDNVDDVPQLDWADVPPPPADDDDKVPVPAAAPLPSPPSPLPPQLGQPVEHAPEGDALAGMVPLQQQASGPAAEVSGSPRPMPVRIPRQFLGTPAEGQQQQEQQRAPAPPQPPSPPLQPEQQPPSDGGDPQRRHIHDRWSRWSGEQQQEQPVASQRPRRQRPADAAAAGRTRAVVRRPRRAAAAAPAA